MPGNCLYVGFYRINYSYQKQKQSCRNNDDLSLPPGQFSYFQFCPPPDIHWFREDIFFRIFSSVPSFLIFSKTSVSFSGSSLSVFSGKATPIPVVRIASSKILYLCPIIFYILLYGSFMSCYGINITFSK